MSPEPTTRYALAWNGWTQHRPTEADARAYAESLVREGRAKSVELSVERVGPGHFETRTIGRCSRGKRGPQWRR